LRKRPRSGAPLPTSAEPFRHLRLESCRSTNDYVRENFSRLQAELPLLVSAVEQTAGRGRDGRGWFSAPGLSLALTFAFRLNDARRLSLLAVASGVAVCEALSGWTRRDFVLKWPNDVLAAGGKVAGILCENRVGGGGAACLVGIGVNLNQRPEDFPPELRGRAASLFMLSGRTWPPEEGRGRLAAAMGLALRRLAAADPAPLLERARHWSRSFLGRRVRFHQGRQLREGIFRGLADDGGLRLETPGGEETVFYGGEIGL